MQLLHINTSILDAGSVTREVTSAIVRKLTAGSPDVHVTYRDLAAEDLPH